LAPTRAQAPAQRQERLPLALVLAASRQARLAPAWEQAHKQSLNPVQQRLVRLISILEHDSTPFAKSEPFIAVTLCFRDCLESHTVIEENALFLRP
jgi:hypothetical protein